MHMADALLSPAVGAGFWAATLGTIGYASKKLKEGLDEKIVPLMGVLGAFIFAAQMINFTIPGTGSSGHLGGGIILAILLGPYAAFLVMASVLTVQSLFFADGGLLALGCNIWNLGIYPCFIAYPLIYTPLTRNSRGTGRIVFASLLSAVIGLQCGAFSVVSQTFLSGKSELPFTTFLLLMQLIHLGIGIVEGVVTAGVINFVRTARPELLETVPASRTLSAGISLRKIVTAFALLALIAGGVLSWFASTSPDGLEWSIQKVYGRAELPGQEHGIAAALKGFQGKTALLPDYSVRKTGNELDQEGTSSSRPGTDAGTPLSGVIGSAMVLAIIVIVGYVVTVIRRRRL